MIDEKVKQYSEELKRLGIEHKIFEHPQLLTVEEVQSYLGKTVKDACATLIMKADDHFVAVVRRGDIKLDFEKLKKLLGVSNLRLASGEEFTKVTNNPVGTAKVYNHGIKTYLEKSIFEKDYLELKYDTNPVVHFHEVSLL